MSAAGKVVVHEVRGRADGQSAPCPPSWTTKCALCRVSAVAAPWTPTLHLSWRPALTFYEKGVEILRCLDERGVLRAFRVGDDRVDARLLDANHELTVRHNGLTLDLFGVDADVDSAWECVVAALQKLELDKATAMAKFQHMVPLGIPFDEAVAVGSRRFLSLPSTVKVADWALLINPDPGSSVEFGIVGAHEAIDRLTRRAGRMRMGQDASNASRWANTAFPDVALFADSFWDGPQVEGEQAVRAYWNSARDRAASFIDALYEKISADILE
jgi:hypothetical protein